LNADLRMFESSQNDESGAQSAVSSKAYSKSRAFICNSDELFFTVPSLTKWTKTQRTKTNSLLFRVRDFV